MPHFPYKSYCWAVGTTSFRTVNFNVQIERQLALLDEFWALPENKNTTWESNNAVQSKFYRFMQEKAFVDGNAPRPEKDARQITSGLVDIGLINDERRLSAAGKALLRISENGDFSSDNLLQISADSFIYLKQLLKMSCRIDDDIVRPYAAMAYVLLQLGQLSDAEFTYLLPLCTTMENTERIVSAIRNLRRGVGSRAIQCETCSTASRESQDSMRFQRSRSAYVSRNCYIDEIIVSRLMEMENYTAARDYFLSAGPVSESTIMEIGMNRKSRNYDKPYYPFYKTLHNIVFERDGAAMDTLYEQSMKINIGKWWRQYLFNTSSIKTIKRQGLSAFNENIPLLHAKTESEFRRLFFELLHLFKAKATLADYADLNKRYFKTTDSVLFVDGTVKFDVLPHCWLHGHDKDLLGMAFETTDNLAADVDLSDIADFLTIDEQRLHENLKELYDIVAATADDVRKVIHGERYDRFNALIDERFDHATLIDLLCKFEQREDKAIREMLTNNADIPTMFEYVLGIAWYVISDRRGDILSYMNLSLEADLLPRSHATGGSADIEYLYEETPNYPAHCLLLEVTLAESSNQRRMEMEPVSRHLGEYILRTGSANAYCVFISTFLHPSVVGDFRSWKSRAYYGRDYASTDVGLKILPLAAAEIQTILENKITYDRLYSIFEAAYHSDEPVPTWYKRKIVEAMPME